MRRSLLLLFAVRCAFAALPAGIPTTGLQEAYDMTSVVSTTLTDLSGQGNNGTLNGTTQTALGTTFNGSTDWISIPKVVGNSNFTVITVAAPVSTSANYIWFEGADNGANETVLATTGAAYIIGNQYADALPTIWGDWHCYYMTRSATQGRYGVLDLNYSSVVTLSGSSTATRASLGTRNLLAGPSLYWTGKLAYVLIYNIALTQQQISSIYNILKATVAARPVALPDLPKPVFPSGVWLRQGLAITGAFEPTMLYTTTDCVLISNPCVEAWYTGSGAVYYAESSDGIQPFTAGSSVIAGGSESYILKTLSGSYWAYVHNASSGNIDLWVSPTGVPNSFTLDTASVVSKGTGSQWDNTSTYNSAVVQVDATHWNMIYEAKGGSNPQNIFMCGVATSSDGKAWSKGVSNPVTGFTFSCGNPYLAQRNSIWYMWTGDGVNSLVRWSSSVFDSAWQASSPLSNVTSAGGRQGTPVFTNAAPDESSYIADPTYLEINNQVLMYYNSYNGTTNQVKLAIANMPLSQLVLTGEGATTDAP